MKPSKRALWMVTVAAVLAATVFVCVCWDMLFLPSWIQWQERELRENLLLEDRQVTWLQNGEHLWHSDRSVPVQDALCCDIDHDGRQELLLLCWKRGKYGESRPFWVERDPPVWSQHIYIYDLEEAEVRPIWMASEIGLEAASWSFTEDQRLVITDRDGAQTAWDWVNWGLSRIPLSSNSQLTFAAVGDNLIHRQIYDYAFRHFDGSFDDLFTGIQSELAAYDVCSINQETPLVEERAKYSSYPVFGTPLEVGNAIIRAGFDLVTCATNHALDQGVEGLDRTGDLFREAGILCPGIQSSGDAACRPFELLERNGITCAVFGYTQTTNGRPIPEETPYILHTLWDEVQVRRDLQAGRAAADAVLVYVHWGTEYAPEPDETQRHWAQLFADCGVDVVIGTHPHVLQPVQWVEGCDSHQTLVYYSLGNFISAQTEEPCRRGGLAWFTLEKEGEQCRILDWGLKPLLTEELNGHYTTRLEEPAL